MIADVLLDMLDLYARHVMCLDRSFIENQDYFNAQNVEMKQ